MSVTSAPTAPGAERDPRARWRARLRARAAELVRFGSVGSVAFVIDMGTYNLLCFGPGDVLGDHPLTARVIAVAISTVASWLGNRHWTFATRRTTRQGRELMLFAVINAVGIGFTVGALWFSHSVLGLSGPFSDNVANIIGIGLGTIVRYLGYQAFVFTGTATMPTSLTRIGRADHTPRPGSENTVGPARPEELAVPDAATVLVPRAAD